jgi:arylsulfatase A
MATHRRHDKQAAAPASHGPARRARSRTGFVDPDRRSLLKALGLGAAAAALPKSAAAADEPAGRGRAERHDAPPNVVLILADDLGWAELGCCGNAFNETPHLDRLAREGMRFTQAYASAPVCSPYRAALMTGQHPARVGITDYLRPNDPKHLSTEHVTIAEVCKRAGYATGIVGKWHLTGYAAHGAAEVGPARHGFDETIVSERRGIGGGSYFHPYHFNPRIRKRLPGREYLTDRQNLEAVEFIQRHRGQPFFLLVSHYAVHTRLNGKPALVAKYEAKRGAGKGPRARRNNPHLAAQLEAIDAGVGEIRKKLDQLGLARNTLIVFTSDNGGEARVTSNAPLRAGKSTLYEGGIRVPLIFWHPRLVPAGTVCTTPTSNVDLPPTFRELAGARIEAAGHVDGVSLAPILRKPSATLRREALYWHYPLPRPHFLGGRSSGAIRSGDWKLIEFFDTGKVELYDLARDRGEANDLAGKMPAKAAELRRALASWRKEVGATIPASCRNYDPGEARRGRQRRP